MKTKFLGIAIWLLILGTSGLCLALNAQDRTLYFMDIHPQKNMVNPAFQNDASVLIVGLSASSFFDNSSLTFSDLLTRKTVDGVSEVYWDFESIDKKLRDKNFLYVGGSVSPIFVGLKLNDKWYLNFSASLKNDSYLMYPGSISKLRFGNANLETNSPRTIDLNNYNFKEQSYTEFSFGASKKVNDKFTYGAHIKALMGLSSIKTNHFLASIETSDDFSESILKTDISMNTSGTLFEADKLKRVFNTQIQVDDFLYGKEAFGFKNFGVALDVGITYSLSDKMDIYASMVDLGFIKWGKSAQQLISNDEFKFSGAYFSPYIVNEDDFDFVDYLKQYADTLSSTVIPDSYSKDYRTNLVPKTYLGASYRYSDKLSFNGLFNSHIYKNGYVAKGTLGATWMPIKRIGLTGTVSYSNFSLYNFGFGFQYKAKSMQVYLVTDNINSLDVWNSRGLNLAFGVHFQVWKGEATASMVGY
ncbi:DUF5723 family protein [Saccharicrinis sp. 156]|uniref:DUF5723 family protein n=1 Tax=Saccharicrinis sp. 156 TaxID=3417574 RepID=UPI003D33D4AA